MTLVPALTRPSNVLPGRELEVERRRRRHVELEGDREARSIALSLGRVVREGRRRLRLTQGQLGTRVGLGKSRIGEIESGNATGTPMLVWVRLGIVLGRPLAMAFSRDLDVGPADAAHLDAQELILRLARKTGRAATFELPTRPDSPARSVDVCLRDDANRTLILNEIWNRFEDMGKATRSTDRKVAEAAALAAVIGGDRPYRVAACWLLLDNAGNRAIVRRYPEILSIRFPGSSLAWIRALTEGGPVPSEPAIAWLDVRAGRLVALRRSSN